MYQTEIFILYVEYVTDRSLAKRPKFIHEGLKKSSDMTYVPVVSLQKLIV